MLDFFLVDREKDAKGKKRNKRSRKKQKNRPGSLRTGPVQHLLCSRGIAAGGGVLISVQLLVPAAPVLAKRSATELASLFVCPKQILQFLFTKSEMFAKIEA
jgi:hypothetical protein